ncbi:hypothetical protein [aff. Roholtiella sp. LEGE 12411]|uniref:hypothetical protein n=1 Tax=aff. Roholtiella sp. LEGE 12411 TaxID=1828822 RepID=UPI00351C287B
MLRKLKIQKLSFLRSRSGLRAIVANTSWLFADRILRMGVGLVVGVWVARYLGVRQYGLFNYTIAFVALFNPGRPHHVNKQSLFSIDLKIISLALAYCEKFRPWRSPPQASLWGFKNNQTRKERFFRWFLISVVIKSTLDAFALLFNPFATLGLDN